jgi:thiol:disulfide interchange protein
MKFAHCRRVLLSLVCALALVVARRSHGYDSSTWFEDAPGFADAARQQAHQHAPMLVYFHTDWCPYCKKFDSLLEDAEVRSRLANVIKVRVNPEHGDAERNLFDRRYGARGYPAIFWVPSETAAPRRISGKGPAREFLAQLTDG